MKYLFLLLFLIQSLLLSAQSSGITFTTCSFREAMSKATAENKLIFLDAYTSWCGPCKEMSDHVFPKPEVGDFFNKRFICLKIDMDKGEGPELLKQFGIKAFPTLLVLDASGKEMHRVVGGRDAKGLINDMILGTSSESCLSQVTKRYATGDRSPKLIQNYLQGLTGALENTQADSILNNYFNKLSDKERSRQKNHFLFRYAPQINHPVFLYLIEHQVTLRNKMGEKTFTETIDAICPTALMNEQVHFKEKNYFQAKYPALYQLKLLPESQTAIILKIINWIANKNYKEGIDYLIRHITQLQERHQVFMLYQFGPYNINNTQGEYEALSRLYQVVSDATETGFVKRACQNLQIALQNKIGD